MSRADKPVYPYAGHHDPAHNGMTLLEHYAGLAMAALVSQSEHMEKAGLLPDAGEFPACIAAASVDLARALIAELEKQP